MTQQCDFEKECCESCFNILKQAFEIRMMSHTQDLLLIVFVLHNLLGSFILHIHFSDPAVVFHERLCCNDKGNLKK